MLGFAAATVASCAVHTPGSSVGGHAATAFEREVRIEGRNLTVHLHPGDAAHGQALVVYATGDGGWRGKDREVYEQMSAWGYATAGFSAPEYLDHLPGDAGTTTPARVGRDIGDVIAAAREAVHLPHSTPAVLVGVSRGADLMVVAAGQPGLRPDVSGVVAMGLTREEEYVRRRQRPDVALELYTYLPRLGELPVSVIQSTRDRYLPASDARALFGRDTPVRRLHAVVARNHSFAGARPRLYALLHDSLDWVGQHARASGVRP